MNEDLFTGYLVDTVKLREIVYRDGVPLDGSDLIWEKLSVKAIQKDGTDSFYMGLALRELDQFTSHDWFLKILEDCRDMNKLPLVSIRGQPVGKDFTFGFTLMPGGIKKFLEDNK